MSRVLQKIGEWLPAFVLFALLIVLWQLAVTVFGVREYLLPSPARVLDAMFSSQTRWLDHILVTGAAIFGAFLIAAVGGVILGTMIAWSSLMNRALMPFLVFVNTLPKVAIAPLFLLWLGYGIGGGWMHAKLALVVVVLGYHEACRRLLRRFEALDNRRSHRWYRVFNEVTVLLFAAIVVLVVVKPF